MQESTRTLAVRTSAAGRLQVISAGIHKKTGCAEKLRVPAAYMHVKLYARTRKSRGCTGCNLQCDLS
jgi:hypothetical protein